LTPQLTVSCVANCHFTELSQNIVARFSSVESNRGVFVTVLQAMDTEQVVDFLVKEVA